MFGETKTGLAAYIPDSIENCLSYFRGGDAQVLFMWTLIAMPIIFGLSYVLDSMRDACGSKACAEDCGTIQRYIFSALTVIMTVVSFPITLVVVFLSLAIAAVIVAGYVLSYPLSLLRRFLIMFLRKISPMSVQDMLETYTGKLLCQDQGGCSSGVVQVEGKGCESGSGGDGAAEEDYDYDE